MVIFGYLFWVAIFSWIRFNRTAFRNMEPNNDVVLYVLLDSYSSCTLPSRFGSRQPCRGNFHLPGIWGSERGKPVVQLLEPVSVVSSGAGMAATEATGRSQGADLSPGRQVNVLWSHMVSLAQQWRPSSQHTSWSATNKYHGIGNIGLVLITATHNFLPLHMRSHEVYNPTFGSWFSVSL